MKIKTQDMTGPALDWAVAKCEGHYLPPMDEYKDAWLSARRFSEDWSQGGPIIEREGISVAFVLGWVSHPMGPWRAVPRLIETYNYYTPGAAQCHAPLVAAMRCYVASKMGDEVEIPDELQ